VARKRAPRVVAARPAPPEAAGDQPDGAADSEPQQPGRAGFRTWGKCKDTRGDLPQIGMAVTRTGIPGAGVVLAGNTNDSALIRQARPPAGGDPGPDRVGR
jgi:hypothetical protein